MSELSLNFILLGFRRLGAKNRKKYNSRTSLLMEAEKLSRRNFLGKSTVAAGGIVTVGAHGTKTGNAVENIDSLRLPREVWITSVSQMGFRTETSREMVDKVLACAEQSLAYHPDIVCLPEVFPFWGINKKYSIEEKVIESIKAMEKVSNFSKANNCYAVCPVYTRENKKIYNAAVIFDRQGNKTGEYRKIHATVNEIEMGISAGPLSPPVFKTDFGIIGVQICFDMMWDDGWKELRGKGAELVVVPSAFPGGQMLTSKAWQNKYVVVSSTNKHKSKICDISGEIIDQTNIWNPNLICAPVNLEKAFLHLWPYSMRFDEIKQRYGKDIQITYFEEEEWGIIESLSPKIKVKDILDEFELISHEELIQNSEFSQKKTRTN